MENAWERVGIDRNQKKIICLFKILHHRDPHVKANLLETDNTAQSPKDSGNIELHSEVRWYGDGNLKLRSDIVLIDVSTLKIRGTSPSIHLEKCGQSMP